MLNATYKKKTVANPSTSIIPTVPIHDFEKMNTPYPSNPLNKGSDLEKRSAKTKETQMAVTNSLLTVV